MKDWDYVVRSVLVHEVRSALVEANENSFPYLFLLAVVVEDSVGVDHLYLQKDVSRACYSSLVLFPYLSHR